MTRLRMKRLCYHQILSGRQKPNAIPMQYNMSMMKISTTTFDTVFLGWSSLHKKSFASHRNMSIQYKQRGAMLRQKSLGNPIIKPKKQATKGTTNAIKYSFALNLSVLVSIFLAMF